MENINFTNLYNLIVDGKSEEAKEMIKEYFYPSLTDVKSVFVLSNGEYKLMSIQELKKVIPSDCMRLQKHKNIVEFSARSFIETTEFLTDKYIPTIRIDKPQGIIKENGKLYLNMIKPLEFNINTATFDATKYAKDISFIEEHIKSIWCSKSNDMYELVLNFITASLIGRKLRKALYLQSVERSGKGQIINLLSLILDKRFYKTNSIESILQYTKPFEGCSLINIDEMPVENDKRAIADKLKGLITERTFECRTMHSIGYTQDNTFNIIITTNNDAINLTQTNKSRYICPDVSEELVGDYKYFSKLNSIIENENVQYAFYLKYIARDISNWNEDIMISSTTLENKIVEALPSIVKYIRDEYVLQEKDLNSKTTDFYERYYWNTRDKTSKQKIGSLLSKTLKINKTRIKKDGETYEVYNGKYADLFDLYKSNKWIREEDYFIDTNEDKNNSSKNGEYSKINSFQEQIKKQNKMIEELRTEVKLLKEQQYSEDFKTIDEDKWLAELSKWKAEAIVNKSTTKIITDCYKKNNENLLLVEKQMQELESQLTECLKETTKPKKAKKRTSRTKDDP